MVSEVLVVWGPINRLKAVAVLTNQKNEPARTLM
jgi:hypothetical protein